MTQPMVLQSASWTVTSSGFLHDGAQLPKSASRFGSPRVFSAVVLLLLFIKNAMIPKQNDPQQRCNNHCICVTFESGTKNHNYLFHF